MLDIFGKHPEHASMMYGTYLRHIPYPPNMKKIWNGPELKKKKSGMLKKEKLAKM